MAIYEVRFLNAADKTMLIYVTIADRMPHSPQALPVASALPYARYEVWCGADKVHEGLRPDGTL